MEYDDESECDELLWVKAGEPGEKPTIIRQVRSDSSSGGSSSRDNSGGSTTSRKLFTVENGALTCLTRNLTETSTSSPDSRVIVVNVSEQVYPAVIDNHRIQRWKEMHNKNPNICSRTERSNTTPSSTTTVSQTTHNNNSSTSKTHTTSTSASSSTTSGTQPKSTLKLTPPKMHNSPSITRCASAEPKLSSPYIREKLLKSRDEGYTSLSEDCKDSDSESVRSKSLPSSWKASHMNKNGSEASLHKYAQKIVSNNNSAILLSSHNNGHCSYNNYTDESSIAARRKLEKKKLRHNLESTIETCTCLLCLRSAMYHAQDEDDTDSLVDHPCRCGPPSLKCGGRWAAISVMVLFFPLLLCYPPLRCCLTLHDARTKRRKLKKDKLLRQRSKQMNCHKTVL